MTTPTLILTADPGFVDLAQQELHRAQPGAQLLSELAPGVWLAATADPFSSVAEQWRQKPPIFIRHICPVQVPLPVHGSRADIEAVLDAVKAEAIDLLDPELPFSVQTRVLSSGDYKPFDFNTAVSDAVKQIVGAPLNVRAPIQILSLVVAADHAYAGVSLAAHNLSDWAGGVHRFAREKGQISRAEFKLLEALDVFDIDLPPRGIALDLGAAPGGWTRVLRQREQYVTAVDPGNLHPSLRWDKNVRHRRMTAEEYLDNEPDQFDFIVNDMRQDARDSARVMVSYARCLYRTGSGLMTFKLPEQGRESVLDHAFNILTTAYQILGARQLFHNRSEITVYLRRQP